MKDVCMRFHFAIFARVTQHYCAHGPRALQNPRAGTGADMSGKLPNLQCGHTEQIVTAHLTYVTQREKIGLM